jgi:hypothetical protein
VRTLLLIVPTIPVIASAQKLPPPTPEWQHDLSAGLMTRHKQTSDGGHLFSGFSNFGTNFGGEDFWLMRLDARGTKLWERVFGGDRDDQVTHVLQTSNGVLVLAGYSHSAVSGTKTSTNFGDYDVWLVGVSAAGEQLWEVTLGTEHPDFPYALEETADGVICGITA